MKVVRDRAVYDSVAKGEPLVVRRKGRKVYVEAPTTVTLASGEIQERAGWEYRAGCPVRLGGIVWADDRQVTRLIVDLYRVGSTDEAFTEIHVAEAGTADAWRLAA